MNPRDRIGLLQQLIAIDTTSGRLNPQRQLQAHVTRWLHQQDARLHISTSPADAFPWTLIRTEAAGPYLLFACHVDTVPVGNVADWDTPPWSAATVDGCIYGRGTVDMKGGLVAAAEALLSAAARQIPVALLLTSDEETGCRGAPDASLSLSALEIGAIIIPEATENQIVTAHRGALWLEVTASGRAAHGSTPQRGENAALKLISVLERARTQLPLRSDDRLGSETWNLGILRAGTAPNIVPASATATIDMRTIDDPGMLLAWWRAQPELASAVGILELAALRTDPASPWLRTLPGEASLHPAPFFTDASVFTDFFPGIPAVIWGPGSPSQMHALNEHLPIASLEEATRNFIMAVGNWPLASH